MLEKIKTPKDVKKLSIAQLQELAEDVRKRIIQVTAKTGGHVAPSLGATDLAIAILKMFDPLEDRIVWDVGHQSYAYKILTERNEKFDTLRQFNGLSGFNNIFESDYDAFGVGHASTSISAALGIAVAKEIQGNKGRAIAVIGDGALTGGISFEALNHVGHLQKDMIVILNDNNFSISKNVGALQSYLTNMLVSKPYNATKNLIYDFVQHLPHRIRRRVILSARALEENMINSIAPNIIFEDLGFKYLGPIDGHDIPRMIRIFHKIKTNLNGPIFVHIVTQKGKGYEHAEDDASRFHGLGPYEIETGKSKKKKAETYSKVFGNTLCKIASKNKNIVAITAAMTDGTGLAEYAEKFPTQFFDVGIAEQHAVTFAGGLAVQGIKPFVAIYSTFLQRAFDQIIHDVALQKLPIVFCLDRAGLVGDDGATHHGIFDLSYLNLIPGLQILIPTNAEEFSAMLEFAADYKDGPIVIRYPRGCAKYLNRKIEPVKIGKGVIDHDGKDVAIVGVGKAMEDAEIIYKELKEKLPNINPYLINPRFLKPLDTNLFEDLEKKIHTIITIEDNALIGGFGDTVKSYFSNSNVRVYSFGIPDEFIEHGTVEQLKDMIGITPKKIVKEIISILK
ncbi:MAG: 1-deoxy-D-xylulose-5-phosphate synthase [Candidatus Cloacimonetes bacterium]|jgi:1-deoxy-D-xylulose-5-phosphate synthase|nr:1-deoxy-D-xylulose-5-phosphate synthase [Candidatus Cloacimonadota bacterium]